MATCRGLSSTLLMPAHLNSPRGILRGPRGCTTEIWDRTRANVDAAQ